MRSPLLTVGVPLYEANRYVESLVADIRAESSPDIEFLFSDQHGRDDAVDRLRGRLADDPRVRFVTSTEEIPWMDNYNLVMKEASGTYVRILAQDDRLVPGALMEAVAVLEASPSLVGAIGPVDLIDHTGEVFHRGPRSGSVSRPRAIDAMGMLGGWRHHEATHGVWRRRVLCERDLWIEEAYAHTGMAVRAWLTGLALRGPIGFVPGYESRRMVHPGSFTARRWRRSPWYQLRRLLDYSLRGSRTWWRQASSVASRVFGVIPAFLVGLFVLPVLRIAQRATERVRAERRALDR